MRVFRAQIVPKAKGTIEDAEPRAVARFFGSRTEAVAHCEEKMGDGSADVEELIFDVKRDQILNLLNRKAIDVRSCRMVWQSGSSASLKL